MPVEAFLADEFLNSLRAGWEDANRVGVFYVLDLALLV
jgi:hypothetical protein